MRLALRTSIMRPSNQLGSSFDALRQALLESSAKSAVIRWLGTTSLVSSNQNSAAVRQDLSLARDRRRQDDVEGREAVRRDDEQALVAQIVDVADLAAAQELAGPAMSTDAGGSGGHSHSMVAGGLELTS